MLPGHEILKSTVARDNSAPAADLCSPFLFALAYVILHLLASST